MIYRRGKKPARPLPAKAIMFADVFHAAKMPVPPLVFGHQAMIYVWHMLGNDDYGDCVWAAKAHMHMLWSKIGGYERDRFTTIDVLSDYASQTGFRADDPASDQGTDMQAAAEYHRKVGIRDATNTRRKVHSYVNLNPGDVKQLALAVYIFGAVEIGVLLPDDADALFDAGKPWDVTAARPTGGHTIPIVGRNAAGNFIAVTWGQLQEVTPAFLAKYMDEAIAYLNDEILNLKGLSPEAYDKPALERMLAKVSPSNAPIVTPAPKQSESPRVPTQAQYDIAFQILRADIDKSGYGWALSDENLRPFSDAVALGVVGAA